MGLNMWVTEVWAVVDTFPLTLGWERNGRKRREAWGGQEYSPQPRGPDLT